MGNQPRYNIQSAIPGGVTTNATEMLARSATGLADTISEISYGIAQDIGIPKAQERGAIAGSSLEWKPGVAIGKIAGAYEASARKANDDYVSNLLKVQAESATKELGDKPNGHAEFKQLYAAQTNALLTAVTPERREYVRSLRDQYGQLGYAATLAKNTENEHDNLKETLKANYMAFKIQAENAAAIGNIDEQRMASGKAEDSLNQLAGMASRVGSDGKRTRVSVDELSGVMYNSDGSLKRDSDGNLIDIDKAYADAGISFEMSPMMPLSEIFKIKKESSKDIAYAQAVGGLKVAMQSGMELDYYHEWETRLDQNTTIPFEDKQRILRAIISEVRSQRRLEDTVDRNAAAKRKQEQKTDNARMMMDIQMGKMPEDFERRARDNAEGDPDGSIRLIGLSRSSSITENDDAAVGEVRDLINNGELDRATVSIEHGVDSMKFTPAMVVQLRDEAKQRGEQLRSGIYSDPELKPTIDSFTASIRNAQGGGFLPSFLSDQKGKNNSAEFYKTQLIEKAEPIIRATPANKRQQVMRDLASRHMVGLVDFTDSPILTDYAGQIRYAETVTGRNEFLPLPIGVRGEDFQEVNVFTSGGSESSQTIKAFNTEQYAARLFKQYTDGEIDDEEFVARIQAVDSFRILYSRVPELKKWMDNKNTEIPLMPDWPYREGKQ